MMKFEELAEAWLEDYQKSVKHKTYINAKQAIENHLYPHFAGIAIDEVKSIDVVAHGMIEISMPVRTFLRSGLTVL